MTQNLENTENNNTQGISYKYALCIVDVNKMGTRTFSYIIPEHLKEKIRVGQAVLVPFGRRKQSIIAFVTGFSNYLQEGIQAKEIVHSATWSRWGGEEWADVWYGKQTVCLFIGCEAWGKGKKWRWLLGVQRTFR